MTQEEKAKAYDEAIRKAKITLGCCDSASIITEHTIYDIFPELKESEDEQHRKWILEYLYDGLRKSDEQFKDQFKSAIAWLEKQGEQKPMVPKFRVGDEIKTVNEEPLTITKIDDKGYWSKDLFICDFDDAVAWDLVEQRPNNKIESKFKVGDWITNGFDCTFQIASIEDGIYYDTNDCGSDIESTDKYYRLWTVADAKDGDVLATSAGAFIYNGNNGGGSCPGSYCGINTLGMFKTGVEHHWTGKKVHPATKEQCDLLFAKMEEAGYEWNENKKELKKISQRMISAEAKEALYDKPAWSEEDNYGFDCVAQCITQATLSSNNKQDSDICKCARNWINSIKQRLINT